MPTGLDHVQATIALCQRLSASVSASQVVDKPAADEVATRLANAQVALAGMQDRFFLRSKLCLPFAVRCEEEAKKLEVALESWTAQTQSSRAVHDALKSLEQAVRVLDDSSGAQGMVIT
jgi:hypothetical protein